MTQCLTASRWLLPILVACFALRSSHAENAWGLKSEITYGGPTVLMGVAATLHGSVRAIDMQAGKVGWVESWTNSDDSLTWSAHVEHAGDYEVSSILESSGDRCAIRIAIDQKTLNAPCGKQQWNRIAAGTVHLQSGRHAIIVSSAGTTPLSKFFSLEFVRPEVRIRLAALGRQQAASTDWMVSAKYGLMFHWTSQSKPPSGPPKSYCDAVHDFDAERFANMVSKMGAGFVVFTTSHAGFYFPGPNRVIDAVLPGRTCPRDLVGDLADALGKRNIRLELYFHPGHDDAPWWQRTHFDEDKKEYFRLWRRIISEIGRQYGTRLAGFWFDDAAFTYYPFNPSWEELTAAAKAGNPARLISYNSWILPKLNDFYEVYAGENAFSEQMIDGDGYLPIGGTGKFTGGPQVGLQGQITTIVNGDWGHFKLDTPIDSPRYPANVMIAKIKDAMSRRNVPLLDVEIYQDGTISPQTLKMFEAIRQAIKPEIVEAR